MNIKREKYLPKVNSGELIVKSSLKVDIVGNWPCPCCGFITIPNEGNALAYICPICLWEIDLFIQREDEASDQNHGLTLNEAKKNYRQFGAILPKLKKYCREPKKYEHPKSQENL
jgi:hypothetical protein